MSQILQVGTKVKLRRDVGYYDGWNYIAAGAEGVVLGYATPDIQKRQTWRAETYYVRMSFDTDDSPGRMMDRDALEACTS